MSKRQRSESTLLEIQSVLPDVPVAQLETLLHQANYNIEAAINIYFTNPPPPTAAPTEQLHSTEPTRVDRFYIGDIVSTGWSTFRGQSPVTEGSPIEIRREKQTGYKKNENKIVRFSHRGGELGRLSKEISGYIATLIDHEQCEFEGSIVWCPSQLKTGDDMILTVRCFLLAKAMHANSFDNDAAISKKQKSIARLLNANNNDLYLTNRKIALLSLFKALGLKPTRSSIRTDESGWDKIIESFETKEESIDPNEDEEKKEVSDDQLNTIYEKAQVFDSEITPMETPETMSLELKPYQKRALAWMMNKESFEHNDEDVDMRSMHPLWEEYALPNQPLGEYSFFYFSPYNGELSLSFPESNSQEKGGILADEMGLGKTIEALSLIHANKPKLEQKDNSFMKLTNITTTKSPTTLIVCPMSLLAQWRDEIIRGSKENTISVKVYYGNERSLDLYKKLCCWDGSAPDVLLTTYGVVMTVANTMHTEKNNGFNLFQVEFWRVMLDEAHQIKNHMSKTSQACREIQARRRWAITGTPIQNKLDDLFALVKFLRHEPWANHTFWNSFITLPFKNQDKNALKTVQTVLEPLVLRRTKQMKDKEGNPMVPLPPKYINIEYLSFTPEEQDIYDAFYKDSKTKFSYFINAGQVGSNYANILQLLTKLRQICCHPYLAIKQNQTTGDVNPSLENLIANYDIKCEDGEENNDKSGKKFGLSILQSMLSKQQASQASSIASADAPSSIEMKTDDGKQEVKMEDVELPDECPICFEPIDVIVAMPCMHMACRLCVLEYFQKRENVGLAGECPVCRVGPILQSELLEITEQNTKTENDNITYEIQRAVGGYRPSSKIQALLKHVKQNLENNSKTVVFSQFTSFLDLIQQALTHEHIVFTRLDGSLGQAQRERVLREFSELAETNVLLISLKAGGVGLNLTCANQVIMMDPWWNFAVEAQAIDRIHRLGQQKDVTVTRFIMRDTVEERILQIQDRKHDLVNELYKTDSQSKGQKLQDLQLLFSSSRA